MQKIGQTTITEAMKGKNVIRTSEFHVEGVAILLHLFGEADTVETLIRERLAAVQVIK